MAGETCDVYVLAEPLCSSRSAEVLEGIEIEVLGRRGVGGRKGKEAEQSTIPYHTERQQFILLSTIGVETEGGRGQRGAVDNPEAVQGPT
jgi:hypothetical protein